MRQWLDLSDTIKKLYYRGETSKNCGLTTDKTVFCCVRDDLKFFSSLIGCVVNDLSDLGSVDWLCIIFVQSHPNILDNSVTRVFLCSYHLAARACICALINTIWIGVKRFIERLFCLVNWPLFATIFSYVYKCQPIQAQVTRSTYIIIY